MILLRDGKKNTTLEPRQINIQLNSERPFHPTSLRREGSDPLTLAILIDVSGDQRDQISALQKYFAEWVSNSLHPQDHVSISPSPHLSRTAPRRSLRAATPSGFAAPRCTSSGNSLNFLAAALSYSLPEAATAKTA
jgi:hypothetical protein